MPENQHGSMSESEAPIIRANVNRTMTTAQNYVSLYVNDTQVQITPWDLRLMFGVISGLSNEDNILISVMQLGEIRMSPQHAKKLSQILAKQVAAYEATFGSIPQID